MAWERILIVEDDPDLRASLALRLAGAGYAVGTAGDVPDALAEVLDRPPSLILLDLRLGAEDGWRVVERLRTIAGASRLPVVLLTASTHAGDRLRARDRGAAAYLTKPFDPQELLAVLADVLSRRNVSQEGHTGAAPKTSVPA